MNFRGSDENYVALGPWGGQHGYQWDDGVCSGIRQVVISWSSDGIHFVQFEYDKKGHQVWSDRHGGNSGTRTDQVKLDYPNQFLVSISGYYGSVNGGDSVIVRALTLETNTKIYGPFGIEKGTPFSLPVNAEIIVGFHGWSTTHLDSIGVHVKLVSQTNPVEEKKMIHHPVNSKKVLSLGPWGVDGRTVFDDGIYTGVREVHITRSGGLVSIRVCYDQNGRAVWGNKNGGSGGLKLDKIIFDYPYEVLTHITGYYGSTILRGPTIIKSITFHTNRRSYGPFGEQQGISFSSGSIGGTIIGFHGTNGYFVHSIGVHVLQSKPLTQPSIDNPNKLPGRDFGGDLIAPRRPDMIHKEDPYPHPPEVPTMKPPEVVWGVPKKPTFYKLGPWGGGGGKPWDDGVYNGIKQIVLTRGDSVCSIQVQYVDQHGSSVWSSPHGISNDVCTYHIKFDFPYEVLISISGYYDFQVDDPQRRVIRSLTFKTNRANYGPYGKAIGTYFSSSDREVKIVGFHGRSGTFLDAIGVHMQDWVNNEQLRHPYPLETLHKYPVKN